MSAVYSLLLQPVYVPVRYLAGFWGNDIILRNNLEAVADYIKSITYSFCPLNILLMYVTSASGSKWTSSLS